MSPRSRVSVLRVLTAGREVMGVTQPVGAEP